MRTTLLLLLLAPLALAGENRVVDHRYTIPWWQTAVCLPDDPDKALVGKEGQFFYDYGVKGAERHFGTSIAADTVPAATWKRQETLTARVPIVRTFSQAGSIEILQEAIRTPVGLHKVPQPLFHVAPGAAEPEILHGWAHPPDAAARLGDVAVGYGGKPIEYVLKAPRSDKVRIAIGLCEGWHDRGGQRPLQLQVEGDTSRTVDLVAEFGKDVPHVYLFNGRDTDGDGQIRIAVLPVEKAPDHNTILNAVWAFEGETPGQADIVSGRADDHAYAVLQFARPSLPPRLDVLLVKATNTGNTPAAFHPVIRIASAADLSGDPVAGFSLGGNMRISGIPPVASINREKNLTTLTLRPMTLAPGESRLFAVGIDRNPDGATEPMTLERAAGLRRQTIDYWTHANLPYGMVELPDPELQAMFDASIRNIYQAREIKRGLPAFQVGPTVYRGLWVVDGSFILEAVAMLGRSDEARAGIEYLMSFQKPDGSFELLGRYWKENGIVLWAVTRHAMLTQDKAWLRKQWPRLQRTVAFIQKLRRQTMDKPGQPGYGLLPPGFIDGGLSYGNALEYSNTEWCLAGLKSAIAAARWLGDGASADAWQEEYDSFYGCFRDAADHDELQDAHGNIYIPTLLGDRDHQPPQKGQWAFCHAVYPGQVFAKDDRLALGQMAMLKATLREGMVFDTGWMKDGIWTYFASFYAHAQLWEGHGEDAAEALYAFANHSSPTRVWREEQKPVGEPYQEVGDMPHNWASAEFIRLTLHLLELDRGTELHLLEGLPRSFVQAGKTTRLKGILTPFGPLTMALAVAPDGHSATLTVQPLAQRPSRLVVHLNALNGGKAVELNQDKGAMSLRVPLP